MYIHNIKTYAMAQQVQLNTYKFTLHDKFQRPNLNIKDAFVAIKGRSIPNATTLIGLCRDFLIESIPLNTSMTNDDHTKNYRLKLMEINPNNFTVYGILTGGVTGQEGDLEKTNGTTPINLPDTTSHPYFFSMHFPINKDYGVLMIQRYGNSSLTTEFKRQLQFAFDRAGSGYTIRFYPYLTEEMKRAFRDRSYVETLTFTKKNVRGSTLQRIFGVVSENQNYTVEIKIKQINSSGSSFQDKINSIERANYVRNLQDFGMIEPADYTARAVIRDEYGNISKPELHQTNDFVEKLVPKDIYDFSARPRKLEDNSFDYNNIKRICDEKLNLLTQSEE